MIRLAIVLTLLILAGCKPDTHEHGEAHAAVCSHSLTASEYGDEEIADQPGAEIGQLTRCPISGSVFRVGEMSPKTVQKGQTYYTCCGGCIDQLDKDFARRR